MTTITKYLTQRNAFKLVGAVVVLLLVYLQLYSSRPSSNDFDVQFLEVDVHGGQPIAPYSSFFTSDRMLPPLSWKGNEEGLAWERIELMKMHAEKECRAKRGLIYFLHFHKGGGTTMCQIVKTIGLGLAQNTKEYGKLSGRERNCNLWRLKDRFWPSLKFWEDKKGRLLKYVIAFWSMSWTEQLGLFSTIDRIEFISNEGSGLGTTMVPPGSAAYLTTIRDPLDRMMSHFHQYVRDGRLAPDTTIIELLEGFYFNNGTQSKYSPGLFRDNFEVMRVAGVKEGPVGEAVLEEAKARLRLFSAVLLLEDYASGAATQIMHHKFGWPRYQNLFSSFRSGSHVPADRSLRTYLRDAGRADLLAEVERRNALNIAFYEYARALNRKQKLQILKEQQAAAEASVPIHDWLNMRNELVRHEQMMMDYPMCAQKVYDSVVRQNTSCLVAQVVRTCQDALVPKLAQEPAGEAAAVASGGVPVCPPSDEYIFGCGAILQRRMRTWLKEAGRGSS